MKAWMRALRIAVSLSLLVALGVSIDWHVLAARTSDIRLGWILGAGLLLILSRVMATAKWATLLRARGLPVRGSVLLRVVWASDFVGHFLPATVGGDGARIWGVARRTDRVAEVAASVIVDRLTGAAALALMASAGLLALGTAEAGTVPPFWLGCAFLAPGILLTLLWTPPGTRAVSAIVSRLRQPRLNRLLAAVVWHREQPGVLIAAVGWSVANQYTRAASVGLAAWSVGLGIPLPAVLALLPAILFVSLLPISVAALGVREGMFVVVLGMASVNATDAFGLALLWRALVLLALLPGGIMLATHGLTARAAKAGEGSLDRPRRARNG